MHDRLNVALLVGIFASFLAAVLLFLFTGTPSRPVGGLLLAVGLAAIAGARGVAATANQPKKD